MFKLIVLIAIVAFGYYYFTDKESRIVIRTRINEFLNKIRSYFK